MDEPIPKGFVRLHYMVDDECFIANVAHIRRVKDAEPKCATNGAFLIFGDVDNDCIEVRETFAEVQAALVRALGAQGDGPVKSVTLAPDEAIQQERERCARLVTDSAPKNPHWGTVFAALLKAILEGKAAP